MQTVHQLCCDHRCIKHDVFACHRCFPHIGWNGTCTVGGHLRLGLSLVTLQPPQMLWPRFSMVRDCARQKAHDVVDHGLLFTTDFDFPIFDANSTLDFGPFDKRAAQGQIGETLGEGHYGLVIIGDANVRTLC